MQKEYGYDVYNDEIEEKMKNLVINSLKSVQDMFDEKKGATELFGYDLMVDEDCNPWLIEINSSPSMDYSTVSITI